MRRQRSIEDLQLIALCELSANRTITAYTFRDGVEHRVNANLFARLTASIDRAVEVLGVLLLGVDNVSAELARVLRGDQ